MKIAKAMIGVKSTYLPAYREGLFTYRGGFSRNRGVYSWPHSRHTDRRLGVPWGHVEFVQKTRGLG